MPTACRPAPPGSLLVIKPSSLGDIVHGLQVVQTVARRMPGCRISWVVRDRFAPLVEAAPFVHEVLRFRRDHGWRGLLEMLRRLRGRRFDVVWDMQGLLRSGLMAAAAAGPEKRGRHDSREGAGWFTRKVPLPAGPGPHHALLLLREFAGTLGVDDEPAVPLELRAGPGFPWEGFFAGDPRLRFVVFSDSRATRKQWHGFAALQRMILERLPGSRVAWCAGRPEKPEFAPPDDRFLNLTGCPLDEMIALIRQPSVFIGNDTGPMHLAAASGNRVLTIFGPSSPARFGPWPADCPRNAWIRSATGRLADLAPEDVFQAVARLIADDLGHPA